MCLSFSRAGLFKRLLIASPFLTLRSLPFLWSQLCQDGFRLVRGKFSCWSSPKLMSYVSVIESSDCGDFIGMSQFQIKLSLNHVTKSVSASLKDSQMYLLYCLWSAVVMTAETQKSGGISELLFPCPKVYGFIQWVFLKKAWNTFCGYRMYKIFTRFVLRRNILH